MGRFGAALTLMLLIGAGLLWPQPLGAQGFELGLDAFRAGDAEKAREVWTPLAESGNPAAQYSLAKLYEKGAGPVAQDLALAVQWYQKAAEQGQPAAQNNLGLMYAQGRGVASDAKLAVQLWRAAAAQNYPWGQYNLALAYFRGQGVEADREQAAAWFRRAADGHLPDAQFIMGQLRREGLVLAKNEGQALSWYRRAAEQGHIEAMKQAQGLEAAGIAQAEIEPPELLPETPPAELATARAGAQTVPLLDGFQSAGESAEETTAARDDGAEESDSEPVEPPAETVAPAQAETVAPAEAETEAETAAGVLPPPPPPMPEAVQQATLPAPEAQPEPEPQPQPEPDAESGTAPEGGGYRVWLASAASQDEARTLWRSAVARHPEALASTEAVFAKVELGGGKALFRILAGPLPDETSASALCQRLRNAEPSVFCKVQTD
jgi:TPR repeat protein